MSDDAKAVTRERHETHGQFDEQFRTAQALKETLRAAMTRSGNGMHPDFPVYWEIIEMCCTKLSRLAHGKLDFPDSWLDIEGYARLGRMQAEGRQKEHATPTSPLLDEARAATAAGIRGDTIGRASGTGNWGLGHGNLDEVRKACVTVDDFASGRWRREAETDG